MKRLVAVYHLTHEAWPQSSAARARRPASSGDFCGKTWSSCWYGAARKGIHFCSSHRVAWQDFKRNGAADSSSLSQLFALRTSEFGALCENRICPNLTR
eukprot:scaffold132100_cov45-Phaeocystis_antarctica.AAC.1